MVIHIFRKDLRLLWPFILGAALVQLVHLAIALRLGVAPAFNSVKLYGYWGYACAFVTQLLIVLAVQQDALVGTRQDWLVRPVARRDMLLAKLLFVLVAVQGLIFLFDLVLGLAHGAPLPGTVTAALFNSAQNIVTTDLIAFLAAAVTENLQQAVIFLLAVLIVKISGGELWRLFFGGAFAALREPIAWVPGLLAAIITLAAAFAILPLQYFRRRTFAARLLLSAAIVLILAANCLPWNAAFAVNEFFSPPPSDAIAFSYNPGLPRRKSNFPGGGHPQIYLPVHIAALPPHAIVAVAGFTLRFSDTNGQEVYRIGTTDVESMPGGFVPQGVNAGPGGGPVIEAQNPTDHPMAVDFYHVFQLPLPQFALLKDRPLRVHVDYAVVLLRPSGEVETIAATGGQKYLPGYGQCAAPQVEQFGVQTFGVWCFAQSVAPHCSAITAQRQDGRKNPQGFWCIPDFTPRWWKAAAPLEPGHSVVPYFWGMANFPVKETDAAQSRFLLTPYEQVAYFARAFDTPALRLADLTDEYDPDYDNTLGEGYSKIPVLATGPGNAAFAASFAPVVCALDQPPAPSPMGHATVAGFEYPAMARADIPLREAQLGGVIDPQYVDGLRVLVPQSRRRTRIVDVARGVVVHRGDRVTLQNSYRSRTQSCAYVPAMITADLGPAPVEALEQ